jgi:hypothetical protein
MGRRVALGLWLRVGWRCHGSYQRQLPGACCMPSGVYMLCRCFAAVGFPEDFCW